MVFSQVYCIGVFSSTNKNWAPPNNWKIVENTNQSILAKEWSLPVINMLSFTLRQNQTCCGWPEKCHCKDRIDTFLCLKLRKIDFNIFSHLSVFYQWQSLAIVQYLFIFIQKTHVCINAWIVFQGIKICSFSLISRLFSLWETYK